MEKWSKAIWIHLRMKINSKLYYHWLMLLNIIKWVTKSSQLEHILILSFIHQKVALDNNTVDQMVEDLWEFIILIKIQQNLMVKAKDRHYKVTKLWKYIQKLEMFNSKME